MKKVKKLFTLALSAAVVSFFLVGCKGNHEHPTGDQQKQELPAADKKADAAKDRKPSNAEHPAKEQPTKEKSAEEQPK